MDGVFVTGTETGVGKTSVCAGLLKLLQGTRPVFYWKPIQTGTIVADDTREMKQLSALADDFFLAPSYRFADPLSPHMAAKKWGKTIVLEEMWKQFQVKKKAGGGFAIVEGAGGLLVPYNDKELQIDFIKRLGLPVLIVGEDRVGVINQMLLTLNACKDHSISVIGVILTRSRRSFGNAEAITNFGNVEVLADLDPVDDVRSLVAQVGGHPRLREIFNVATLPN
jgi:dethiobiotin synthetase